MRTLRALFGFFKVSALSALCQRFDRSQFCVVGLADLLKPIGDNHLLLAEFGGDRPYPLGLFLGIALIKIAN